MVMKNAVKVILWDCFQFFRRKIFYFLDQLDFRVANKEPPCVPDSQCGLHREPDPCPGGRDDLAQRSHRSLHFERAGGSARAVVAVEPAGDRIAAEVDDVAAETLDQSDQRVEHPIQVGGQLLGAALRPKDTCQPFGQRGKAGNVGEKLVKSP